MVEVAVYTFRSRGAQCAGDVEVVDGEAPRRFPFSHRVSPPLPSSARELGDLTTNLINRLQRVTPSENRTIEEIAQLSKDQDAKTKDHVGRIQSMLDSLAVRLCDETQFATKAVRLTVPRQRSRKVSIRGCETRSIRPDDLSE